MARADDVTARRRPVRASAVAVVVAVGLAAATAGCGGRAARSELAEASSLVTQAEPAVLAVDRAVRSEVTTATTQAAEDALRRIPPAVELLTRAQALVERARGRIADKDRALADALDESIAARMEMLKRAEPVLKADVSVATALGPAMEAWSLVASAEKKAEDAVAAFNAHTKQGVQRSTQLTTEADASLAKARSLLETVAAGVPEADMAPFVAYIDAKRALLAESRRIDATWLAGKVADANAMLGAYNAKEKQVAEQAKRLPGSPASVLAQAYRRIVEKDVTAYFEAREKARSADVRVRSLNGG
ncbi:MAG: hypothetical protein N3B11_05755 [Coriobacteriia bacterium]|nr:hypothetical protein [Coriobacteriia bacterium]